jgi:hypothetical protein
MLLKKTGEKTTKMATTLNSLLLCFFFKTLFVLLSLNDFYDFKSQFKISFFFV